MQAFGKQEQRAYPTSTFCLQLTVLVRCESRWLRKPRAMRPQKLGSSYSLLLPMSALYVFITRTAIGVPA